MKKTPYVFLALMALLSLLCSVAASCVTNENLMQQGFLQFSDTRHLNVPPTRYADYARAITRYLDGKAERIQVADPASGEMSDAFSEKETAHLRDVKSIVTALKWARWLGGGGAVLTIGILYLLRKDDRPRLLSSLVRGFALASLILLAAATGLAVWGAVNFNGLFWTFHQVIFTNSMWQLNPRTDLLMALMPLSFSGWYAGELCKALLPVLGVMLLVIFTWIHIGKTQKETKKP